MTKAKKTAKPKAPKTPKPAPKQRRKTIVTQPDPIPSPLNPALL